MSGVADVRVAIVRGGKRPPLQKRGQMSGGANVRGGKCPGGQMSGILVKYSDLIGQNFVFISQ